MTEYQIIALSISGSIVYTAAWLHMARWLYHAPKWDASTQGDLASSLVVGFSWFLVVPCQAVAWFVTAPKDRK